MGQSEYGNASIMDHNAVLDTAKYIVNGDRQTAYGTPENNFQRIADLWTAYDGRNFTAHDVAMFLALLKAARIKTGIGTADSYVDLCGYAALAADMSREGDSKPNKKPLPDRHNVNVDAELWDNNSLDYDMPRISSHGEWAYEEEADKPQWQHARKLCCVYDALAIYNILANKKYDEPTVDTEPIGHRILMDVLSHVLHADNTHPWTDYSVRQALDIIQAELYEAREQYNIACEYGYDKRDAPLADEAMIEEHLAHMFYEIGDMIAPAIKLLRMQYE